MILLASAGEYSMFFENCIENNLKYKSKAKVINIIFCS